MRLASNIDLIPVVRHKHLSYRGTMVFLGGRSATPPDGFHASSKATGTFGVVPTLESPEFLEPGLRQHLHAALASGQVSYVPTSGPLGMRHLILDLEHSGPNVKALDPAGRDLRTS